MAKISPFKFLQEVRAEAQKVTWPTRRETAITTAMVFVMVAVAAVFFLLADQVMRMSDFRAGDPPRIQRMMADGRRVCWLRGASARASERSSWESDSPAVPRMPALTKLRRSRRTLCRMSAQPVRAFAFCVIEPPWIVAILF